MNLAPACVKPPPVVNGPAAGGKQRTSTTLTSALASALAVTGVSAVAPPPKKQPRTNAAGGTADSAVAARHKRSRTHAAGDNGSDPKVTPPATTPRSRVSSDARKRSRTPRRSAPTDGAQRRADVAAHATLLPSVKLAHSGWTGIYCSECQDGEQSDDDVHTSRHGRCTALAHGKHVCRPLCSACKARSACTRCAFRQRFRGEYQSLCSVDLNGQRLCWLMERKRSWPGRWGVGCVLCCNLAESMRKKDVTVAGGDLNLRRNCAAWARFQVGQSGRILKPSDFKQHAATDLHQAALKFFLDPAPQGLAPPPGASTRASGWPVATAAERSPPEASPFSRSTAIATCSW